MMFKLKVADTLRPEASAILTFFDANDDLYHSVKLGDRLRLSGLQPSLSSAEPCISLNMTKASKVVNYTDLVLKPKKLVD